MLGLLVKRSEGVVLVGAKTRQIPDELGLGRSMSLAPCESAGTI